MKVKTKLPVPSIATSGRWAKRADGEWGFDFDEAPRDGENEEMTAPELINSGSDDDDDDAKTLHQSENLILSQSVINKNTSSTAATASAANTTNSSSNKNTTSVQAPINLVLRMRDERKELQDIKFEFLPNKDTVDEISHELVNARLIDAIDMVAVSANLNKLLENHSLSPITFPLVG